MRRPNVETIKANAQNPVMINLCKYILFLEGQLKEAIKAAKERRKEEK